MGISIYLWKWLLGPRWLIPKVAQPQVPPFENRKRPNAFPCVPSHSKTRKRERSKSVGKELNESGDCRYGDVVGYGNVHRSGLL
jgi:hypothetical protein